MQMRKIYREKGFMAHALNTFHYRAALGTRVNPDTIGPM